MPHLDMKDFHWFMGVKFAVTALLFKTLAFWQASIVFILVTLTYRHVVARVLGIKIMPVGDFNTFVTNSKAPTNIMTFTPVSNANYDYAK